MYRNEPTNGSNVRSLTWRNLANDVFMPSMPHSLLLLLLLRHVSRIHPTGKMKKRRNARTRLPSLSTRGRINLPAVGRSASDGARCRWLNSLSTNVCLATPSKQVQFPRPANTRVSGASCYIRYFSGRICPAKTYYACLFK